MIVNLSVHVQIFKINHVITRDKLLSLVFGRFALTIFTNCSYNLVQDFCEWRTPRVFAFNRSNPSISSNRISRKTIIFFLLYRLVQFKGMTLYYTAYNYLRPRSNFDRDFDQIFYGSILLLLRL